MNFLIRWGSQNDIFSEHNARNWILATYNDWLLLLFLRHVSSFWPPPPRANLYLTKLHDGKDMCCGNRKLVDPINIMLYFIALQLSLPSCDNMLLPLPLCNPIAPCSTAGIAFYSSLVCIDVRHPWYETCICINYAYMYVCVCSMEQTGRQLYRPMPWPLIFYHVPEINIWRRTQSNTPTPPAMLLMQF